jgi:general secretion pathway protein D
MKALVIAAIMVLAGQVRAEDKIKFNFNNEDITKVIEVYAKGSGQKFIVDSTVRGRITILNPTDIPVDDAFNQLSEGLAINGFAAVKNGDGYTIRNARSAQRDNLPVYNTELPPAKPIRMVTWIVSLKHISADDISRDLRLFTSSYGEMSVNTNLNQLIFTDWSTNIQRISEIIKFADKPIDPSTAKIVANAKKERKEWAAEQAKKKSSNSSSQEPNEPPEKEKSKN